jgi:uncharacterized protein
VPAGSSDLAAVAIRALPGGCGITVRVQPRAARDEVVGAHGDALKVRLTAPPVEGRANAALVALLAKALGVSPSAVAVTTGQVGRIKVVTVAGLRPEEARARLGRAVAAGRSK